MEESGKDSSVAFLDASELGEADLSFEYLMSGVAEDFPERYETRKYALSDKGLQSIEGAIAAMRGNKRFSKAHVCDRGGKGLDIITYP